MRISRIIIAIMSQVQTYVDIAKERGLRITKARELLAGTIVSFARPFTAEEVILALENLGLIIHKATVYRDLAIFVKKGLLKELVFRGSMAHFFDVVDESNVRYYFMCRECRNVTTFESDNVTRSIKSLESKISKDGFLVESHGLKFYGLCSECRRMK